MQFIAFLALMLGVYANAFGRDGIQSTRVTAYFNVLKNLPVDLTSQDSAIEEEIARLNLYHQYDPELYHIEKNLVYFSNRRLLGELDIVVRERSTGRVVLVGEVKR